MKKFLLFVVACCFYSLQAQDIIVLNDKTEIEAKVLEVKENEVIYKNWNNLEGPSYVISKSRIEYIKYINGTKDDFSNYSNTTVQRDVLSPYEHDVFFHTYLELGVPFTYIAAGPSFQAVLGARIHGRWFTGLSVGIDALISSGAPNFTVLYNTKLSFPITMTNIPIMFNARWFALKGLYFHPFIDVSCGINMSFYSRGSCEFTDEYGRYVSYDKLVFKYVDYGARLRVLLGFEYKRFEIGLGYDFMALRFSSSMTTSRGMNNYSLISHIGGNYKRGYTYYHMGYFKVGVRLGKMRFYKK